jgi:hypothetical protein
LVHESQCTAGHENILNGRAHSEAGSFGAFIAAQPVGAEVISMSGRRCRWTGEYGMSSGGHRAALLECLDRPELGTIEIWTCLGNVWNATGRSVDS